MPEAETSELAEKQRALASNALGQGYEPVVELGGKERGRVSRGQMIAFQNEGVWVVGQVQVVPDASGKTKIKIDGKHTVETEIKAEACLSGWAVVRKIGGRRQAAPVTAQ